MNSTFRLPKFFLCIALIFSAASSHSEETIVSILRNKPVFTLDIHAYNVSFFVSINGVAAYREFDHDGQVTLTVPVNHYMHPEENRLALEVTPPDEGAPFQTNSNVKVDLNVHEHGDRSNKHRIATLTFEEKHISDGNPNINSSPADRYSSATGFKPDPQGDVKIEKITTTPRAGYEGALVYERRMTIPNSLPLWAFFNSDDLPNYYTVSDEEYYKALDELVEQYRIIEDVLKGGDVEEIMPFLAERNNETDAAFYFEPGTTEQGIRKDLLASASDKNLELLTLEARSLGIMPEENGKIVSLHRADMGPAIALNLIEGRGAYMYPAFFRRENGEWILTR